MVVSAFQDQQYMFGVRSLLIVKKSVDEERPGHAAGKSAASIVFHQHPGLNFLQNLYLGFFIFCKLTE